VEGVVETPLDRRAADFDSLDDVARLIGAWAMASGVAEKARGKAEAKATRHLQR
jgi:hypothetical protein